MHASSVAPNAICTTRLPNVWHMLRQRELTVYRLTNSVKGILPMSCTVLTKFTPCVSVNVIVRCSSGDVAGSLLQSASACTAWAVSNVDRL